MEELIRLNKFLSMAGICSRREADRLIEEGRVTVNGHIAVNGSKVSPADEVCLDRKRVTADEKERIIAVHKPCGVVCTTDSRWGDVRLDDIVDCGQRVFYVGRLDKNSRGLILMTNQGDLANRMMKAVNYHEKEYMVTVDRDLTEDFLSNMREGVWLDELQVKTRACVVKKTGKRQFRIILTQGLNRQIRRMCHTLGYEVTDLLRTRVMNIFLDDLKEGCYRELSSQQYDELKRIVYGNGTHREPEANQRSACEQGKGRQEKRQRGNGAKR